MNRNGEGIHWDRICFFAVLLLIAAVTTGSYFADTFRRQVVKEPRIEDGVLDLSGWNPDQNPVIHLDGRWEFYWNRLIVSETGEAEGRLEPVPSQWRNYVIDGKRLSDGGLASYRIHVINCPEAVSCVSYVPNFQGRYQIFFNDKLVTDRSFSQDWGEIGTGGEPYGRAYTSFTPSETSDFDVTIEMEGEYLPGLRLTPILAESSYEFFYSSLRYVLASVYFGVMLISLIALGFILYGGFRGMSSLALYILSLFMFMRILLKDEFIGIIRIFMPFHNYFVFNNTLKVLTLTLPFVFFFYMGSILNFKFPKDRIQKFMGYELTVLALIVVCIKEGLVRAEFFLNVASLVPFIPMFVFLYRNLEKDNDEILLISLCLMFLIGSLLTGSLYHSGLLATNISMIPSTLFLAFILTQDSIFIHKIMGYHKAAIETANLRLRLEESQTALMLSQIKPHFLYNALVAIQVLCTKDPKAAQKAIYNFSQYLRGNMTSINSSVPIPFEQELKHIKNYTAIEELRFQERLKVHYEIECTDFSVPPLTIQPLVENAIKHGATKNVNGGNVWLSAYETEEDYIVKVRDDGPGFDLFILEQQDSASYGIRNITLRLKQMIGARISFDSCPDKMTEVTVAIPKKRGTT